MSRLRMIIGLLLMIMVMAFLPCSKITASGVNKYYIKYTGETKTFTTYLPSNSQAPNDYHNLTNTYEVLKTKCYPITIVYTITRSATRGWHHMDKTPWLKIKSCAPDGTEGEEYVNITGNKSGNFTLPADYGMYINVYTGRDHHDISHSGGEGYDWHLTLEYQYDEAPPNAPGIPEVVFDTNGKVSKIDDYHYITSLQSVPIRWHEAVDNGSQFSAGGNTYETKSGISEYRIKVNNSPEFSVPADQLSYNISDLPEGENTVKIRALDKEPSNPPGPYSEAITIKIDRTKPSVPGIPQVIVNNPTNITWTWSESNDGNGSGIKGYKVYLASINEDGTRETIADWQDVTKNQYTHQVQNGKTYVCQVKAVDLVTNESLASPEGSIIIDRSVPKVTLPQYPIHLRGKEATFHWEPITTDYSGVQKYQVALTTTTDQPTDWETVTSETNGRWEKTFTINSLQNSYYAWVRGVDIIGNIGDWTRTGPFPEFDVIGPDDNTYTNQLSPEFGIKKRSFAEDKDLRFEIFYKKPNETPKKFSETQAFPGEGHFLWWIEVYEYLNGIKQENSKQTSKEYTLYIDQTAPTGSFGISSIDGLKDYTQVPTNSIDMKLTGIKATLDDTGIVNSGVKRIYLWNSSEAPTGNEPPSYAQSYTIDEINNFPEDGLPWILDQPDGTYWINMIIEDNAGNRSNPENMPYKLVTLDRTAPQAPVNITHTQGDGSISFNWQAGSASDGLALYRGTYQLPEETPVDFEVLPSEDNSGVKTVPITGTEPNQPVIITIKAVDRAGNESEEANYTAYTPAQPGQLQFCGGGYDISTGRHFMIWQATSSAAKEIYLEYSLGETEFKSRGTILPNEEGLFIHDSLTNPDGDQPLPLSAHGVYSYRLVAVNGSGDKKYSEVETKQVPNQKPSIPEIIAPLQFARDSVEFQFTPSVDQDGDPLTYTVYFAERANPNSSDFKPLPGYIKEGLVHGRTYSWYLHVEDGYGGDSTDIMSFTVDTGDPELDVEDAVLPYTNQGQLTISAGDSLSGIDQVTYKKYILNQKGEVEREEEGEISLTADFDGKFKGAIPLTEGQYHLHITAWDKAGNDFKVERNNLIVDHTSPELSGALLKLPQANGRYLCGSGLAPLAWRGTDSSSGVRNLRYWIIPSQGEPLGSGKTLPLSSGLTDYEYNLDLTGINGNEYFLAIALEDKAGNRSPELYLGPILLDTTGPQGQLKLSGLAVSGSNYYLTTFDSLVPELEASDPESDIISIRYAVIDTTVGTRISAWTDWNTIKQTALTEGKTYKVAVKIVNGSGLEAECQSVSFTYDASAPENLTISGPAEPLTQGEQGLFTVSATENESRIIAYRFAIGATPGGKELTAQVPGNIDGWLIMNTEAALAQFRVEIPMMADGTYYPTFEALNAAGLKQTKTGSEFIINNNQRKTVVGDQGTYTEFNDHLTGWWRYSGPEKVVGYRYRIVNAENGEPVRNWEPTTETEVTVTGLNLENGLTYRFEVEADLGGISVSGVSPGVKVDITKAIITKLETPRYSTSANLSFAWAGEDPESGITRIEAALGTDFYQTDVTKGWVQVSGDRPQLTRDRNGEELNLVSGQRYYLTLRLINGSRLVTEQAAPAIIIDDTPPPTPLVIDQGAYINDQQPLEANWLWSEVDPESGVIYEWALLDNSQDLNNVTWNPGPDNFRIRLEDFTQEHGHTYYFAVKAINGAGLTTVAVSNGIMVDSTAPLIPRVVVLEGVDIGDPATAEEVNYLTSAEELTLWIDSMDLESEINRYEYAYGSRDDVDAAPKETSTSETVELEGVTLLNGEVSIFKGECFNNAELVSQPGYSTGVMLDTGAPQISNVKAGVSGNQILFDWEAESSASPIAGYVVALVTDGLESANLPDSAWQDVKLSRSVVIDGSDMADGDYRLLVRAYNRAGTYSERGISPKVTLDRTPPVVQELISAKYASNRLSVAVVVEDNLSGIHSIQYSLGSLTNPVAYTGGWIDLEDQGAPVDQEQLVRRLEFEIPTAGVPDRSKTYLTVRVKDKVGLWSELKVSEPILIDHTPPSKPEVLCAPYTRSREEILGISCKSSDPESGLTHYRMGLVTDVEGEWLVAKLGAMDEFDGNLTHLQLDEAGVYRVAIQTLNAAGDWSEIGYSEPITVDSIEPELVFVKYNETIVINEPPLNVEYILNEDAKVKFTIIGQDGKSYEEEVSGVKGVNQYVFNKIDKQIYFVSAIPTDLAGNPGVATEKTNQTIRVNAPPEIVLEGINATPGQPLRFKATVTDPDSEPGDTLAYEWLPGDGGAILNGAEPEYRYINLGEYTLTLTVIDKDGGKTSKSATVTIGNTTGGTLYMDEVWSGIHRIYKDVTVPEGINLTIKPGTEVIVDGVPGEGYFHGLIIKGDLIIEGSGVTFSSSQNGKGAWKGIRVEGRANIDGVEILNAARGLTVVNDATVAVTNSNFHDNQIGIHIYRANPVIQGTVFRNNDWYGIKEDGECSPLVVNCTFTENEVDYYHDQLTAVTMEELNDIGENEGNSK